VFIDNKTVFCVYGYIHICTSSCLNICLKVYLIRFSDLVKMVSFNVCIILDRVMVSATNVTNMCFLGSTNESKCFPSEP
jgi:hypothetical protein